MEPHQVGDPHEVLTRPADDFVATLMATPKRQANQLEALANGATKGETR